MLRAREGCFICNSFFSLLLCVVVCSVCYCCCSNPFSLTTPCSLRPFFCCSPRLRLRFLGCGYCCCCCSFAIRNRFLLSVSLRGGVFRSYDGGICIVATGDYEQDGSFVVVFVCGKGYARTGMRWSWWFCAGKLLPLPARRAGALCIFNLPRVIVRLLW